MQWSGIIFSNFERQFFAMNQIFTGTKLMAIWHFPIFIALVKL